MAIIVKNKNIKENIEDEDGNILGSISYNPDDVKAYRKLCDIIDIISKISKDAKNLDKLGDIKDDITSLEKFEKYSELFSECRDSLHNIDDAIEVIKTNIDEIFGNGTSNIMMGEGHDVDLLMPLLDEVMPKFKEQRKDKVNKYLDNEETVM